MVHVLWSNNENPTCCLTLNRVFPGRNFYNLENETELKDGLYKEMRINTALGLMLEKIKKIIIIINFLQLSQFGIARCYEIIS